MENNLRNFVYFGLLLAGSLPAHALTIVRTNDPSLAANLSPADVAAASAAFDYAAAQYSALYNDPIQVNIVLAAVPGTGTLGGSSTALVGFFSYTTIRNALIADAVSPDDLTAIATLPVSDPTGAQPGLGWVTSRAQGKALGLIPSDATSDGTFTFGAGFSYTYDPNNRAVAGKFDFIGVAFHEISEIMGRIPGLGTNFGDGGPDYLPFDLFRYTGLATRSFIGGSGNYFSINNGATDLKNFNFPNGNGSDPQDWASGANDAYNAFSSSSVLNALTAVDIQVMDVIGYNLNTTGPIIVATGATLTAEGCTPTNGVIDPNETVTVNFALQNTGGKNASNVVATLLATSGVTAPSGAQSYGTLIAGGGAVSEPFTFTANGTCASNITATLQIQTNSANYGTATFTFSLGAISVTTNSFTNSGFISIPTSGSVGTATPYPSTINVSGLVGTVSKVTVALANINHTWPDDISILLVGPGGQKTMLMSDAGGNAGATPMSNVTVTFDDAAATQLPQSSQITSGTYRPGDYDSAEVLDLPAPVGPYGTTLSVFNGVNPNGTWSLYVDDDFPPVDGGSIANGWVLSIISGTNSCCTGAVSPASFRITSIVRSNNNILISWTTGIGQTNALQATAGTSNGSYATNNFANIFSVTNTVTTSTNYTDVGAATNFPSRYYRVRLVP